MDAPAVSIGTVVAGRYRVDEQLGEGGMGAVWAVVDLETGAEVALKVVLDASADHVKRFEREVKATMRIESEHVVRVIDVGMIEERVPFMVMERLEGDTLKALVLEVPLGERAVADLMLQACEGLAHAHALGIVHRDVKPSNLFVLPGPSPTLKVLDFGISRITSLEAYADREKTESMTVTDSAALLGSPQYASPEQLQSASSVDERADIWSLGISMHYALTGQLPFTGGSLAEVLVSVMSRPIPKISPNIASEPMRAAVERCLSRTLDQRYRRMSDLADALAPLASPARAALAPKIRAILEAAAPIVAPVPPSKLRDLDTTTQTYESFDQKKTVEDLRSARPLSEAPIAMAAPLLEPFTAPAIVVASPRPQSFIAFAFGLIATIAVGAFFLVNHYRRTPPPIVPAASAEVTVVEPPKPVESAEPTTDTQLELSADSPIARVVKPASNHVELTDGRAMVSVAPFKSDLAVEVELTTGARARGIAKPGGPTQIKLTTTAPSKSRPRPAKSNSELHKSPYE